ncbi:putative SNAP25 homologous protein SNAP30 [Sesamum angolense]|uniref:SNAP25 homologous protein SNAP30 n=1 Tax=Sesamum angolense TaxID=2727404 RepID=A0AAE1X1V5_9LAMI|nr:putative SNAP25 homologous protein SNAP30 [Sesamum angolense]
MFGFRKSPAEQPEDDKKNTAAPARRASSEPSLALPDDPEDYFGKAPKNKQKKDFDSMSQQELEGYAVNQAEETTKSVNKCLKIAEDIRQDATRTLDTLHEQGEQIHRTHVMAANMDKDLSKGEKLLNNLGECFQCLGSQRRRRPSQARKHDNDRGKRGTAEEREKLGLSNKGKGSRTPPPEPTNALQKIDVEKSKQDDGLNDLSDILGELKGMAVDMGSELDRQNKALDDLQEDVDELNSRVKGANRRAQKLIEK